MQRRTIESLKDDKSLSYHGDGLYCTIEFDNLWLYSTDGEVVTNQVCLEPQVLVSVLAYVRRQGLIVKTD